MNEEELFRSPEDVELLIQWMQAPPNAKPVVPFDAEDYLERLQLALRWLYEHMSVRKVWRMMFEHYRVQGRKYSESTARRDVSAAQRLFRTDDSHEPAFWSSMMIDALGEQFMSARRAHKYAEAVRLAKELRDWIRLAMELGMMKDVPDKPPTLLIAVATPAEAGLRDDPEMMLRVEEFLKRRAEQKKVAQAAFTDATYSEDDTDPGT